MYNQIAGFFAGLKPIPLLKVSEWAAKNRYLTTESAAEPGVYKVSRTPYLQEIMDALSPNSPVQEVASMKGVQLGFTDMALNVVGCYMDIAACPIMYVMPTIDLAKAISEGRVDPMIENSPALRQKVKPVRERDSGNTKFVKKFMGGLLSLSGANSAASLRSRPVKILILDEVDAYPLSLGEEGSPISLAKKRTATFGSKKKIFMPSTPTLENISVIEREFLATDQRYYFVPCPHCGIKQKLIFEKLIWQKGNYDDVKYCCEHCGCLIEERFKTKMLAEGEWRITAAQNKNPLKRGYHLNSLYSPIGWMSWAEIAKEYDDSEGDEPKRRVFVNTILGETFKNDGEAPEWQRIYNRRETYRINEVKKEVCFLTAGCDVQKDRIEIEIVGWCRGKRSYSIDHRVIPGDTSASEVWNKLALIVNEQWQREDGIMMPLKLMAVDSGYNTSYVYDFCKMFDATRVIPIKGKHAQDIMVAPPKAVFTSRAGKKIGTVKVWNIGVSMIKSELYGWLRQEIAENGEIPAGYCHFPEYNPEYFKGLTAEHLMVRPGKLGMRYEWVKKYDRNEPLDMRVYARAAAAIVGMDRFQDEHWDAISNGYVKSESSKPKSKKGSDYWGGGSYWK